VIILFVEDKTWSSWWIDHYVGGCGAGHLGLIPGNAALLVNESVDDGRDAP